MTNGGAGRGYAIPVEGAHRQHLGQAGHPQQRLGRRAQVAGRHHHGHPAGGQLGQALPEALPALRQSVEAAAGRLGGIGELGPGPAGQAGADGVEHLGGGEGQHHGVELVGVVPGPLDGVEDTASAHPLPVVDVERGDADLGRHLTG